MLYEIQCDKFAEKKNGVFVTRPCIRFEEGLNTILGDKKAENSIGKSTFLMIVDFCFGGDDYVDSEKCNAKDYVHEHTINFTFKFGDRFEYYSRCTTTPYEIKKHKDDKYEEVLAVISTDDFKKHLFESYQIKLPNVTFRNIVGRYMRIYGKDNYSEKRPLKYGDETEDMAIVALEKLFDVFAFIEGYRKAFEDLNARKAARKKATDLGEMTNVAKNKTQVKENEKEIARLEAALEQLTATQDIDLSEQDREKVDKTAEIKGQISLLKRRRTRLTTQINTIRNNMKGEQVPTEQDFNDLSEFFPEVDFSRLEMIESFHHDIQKILQGEMSEEIAQLEFIISKISTEIERLEEEQRKLGIPVHVSKRYMKQYTDFQRQIDILKAQNEGFKKSEDIIEKTKAAKAELESAREKQLDIIKENINQELVRLNDFIYANAKKRHKAPAIDFDNKRSGNPKYTFKTESDGGTGTNYKSMIIFDLCVLKLTQLPAITHDSLVFKNIGDLPIDQIMQLYSQSKKQIFISFDKKDAFSQITKDIIDSTTRLELYSGGGELFGWSWAEVEEE